jgi:glycosyltransferase involved in cell wall biosynthesis
MESGKLKKLRVVWVCHFSNEKIHELIGVKKHIHEKAPWISLGIEEVEKRDDIELHVVAPYKWLRSNKEFEHNGVKYYFFNPNMPFWGRHWPGAFRWDYWTSFNKSKNSIYRFIQNIKPDIIHLHGFENPYYSVCALDKRITIPFLTTVQGIFSISADQDFPYAWKRSKLEVKAIKSQNHFGVRNDEMIKVIKEINGSSKFYWHEYFLNASSVTEDDQAEKNYDLIFFARLTKDKGIEDFIEITKEIKAVKPDVKSVVIGYGKPSYTEMLKDRTIEYGLEENILFKGFLKNQEEVFSILSQSKVCVLPTYNDVIPGTIIESMMRKIPVVTYATGGIPDLNRDGENVLMSDQGDVKSLLNNTLRVLNEEGLVERLTGSAARYAKNRWSNTKAMDDIVDIYTRLINN